jgi:hypothetical protein
MDADIPLKIWAVLGPLLTAAISALWARRVQTQDREHERKIQEALRSKDLSDKAADFRRTTTHAQMAELRVAIAHFIAATNEFLMSATDNKSQRRTHETLRLEHEAAEKMNLQFQLVAILAPDSLAALASTVLNIASDFPAMSGPDLEFKIQDATDKYGVAKSALTKQSRALLGLKAEA